jgi:hypothetical protein
MYDMISIEKITCPHCRQENVDFEFQCQSFSNLLFKYEFPDTINNVADGKYEIHGICDICSSFIKGKVFVENELLKKISYWVENCPVHFIVADMEHSLKQNLRENKFLKESDKEHFAALKAVLLKIKLNEPISQESITELEKIFSISFQKEKKNIDKNTPSFTIVTGTKKYYVILSNKKEESIY